MKILKELEDGRQFLFVIFTAFFFFLLRLPSFFEPLWYGDEGIYQVVGTALNHEKLLYKEIFDNKPPLLYWLYAFFQSDQFSIRFASAIFGILSIVIFFLLAKRLFGNGKNIGASYLATLVFAILFGLPALEGNIANAENFMLLPVIFAGFLIFRGVNSSFKLSTFNSQFSIFLAGLLLGIAFLFKIVAVFDFAAFFIFCFILNFKSFKNLKKETKLSLLTAGFILPILLTSLYFVTNGTFLDFAKATFISNISYVGYGNRIGTLPILLFIKLAILGIFILYVFAKRKKISKTALFILIWLAFSLFNAFFSQRAYTHYLLVLIPSLSLTMGLILFDKKYRKITVVIFLIALLTIIKVFGVPKFNKIINYYQNFISYVGGEKTMESYQAFFDRNTPSDYEVTRFIRPKLAKNDTVFVWGNNAQLYQIIGVVPITKYVVAYHILNYKDGKTSTEKAIEIKRPKFIITMGNSSSIPFSLTNYFKKIKINNATIYERLF